MKLYWYKDAIGFPGDRIAASRCMVADVPGHLPSIGLGAECPVCGKRIEYIDFENNKFCIGHPLPERFHQVSHDAESILILGEHGKVIERIAGTPLEPTLAT